MGAAKAALPAWQVLFMAVVAGAYISFGAMLLLSVGGACTALGQVRTRLSRLSARLIDVSPRRVDLLLPPLGMAAALCSLPDGTTDQTGRW